MHRSIVLLSCVLGSACGGESPHSRAAVGSDVAAASSDTSPRELQESGSTLPVSPSEAARVLVLETTELDRTAEVIGPVDVHEPMGSDQAALRRLQEKAAAIGADAVVGVEFHHGEAEGEPTHLSGLAVRFVAPVTGPVH